jgi:glycerophosphoryl diester phosphodiesterase
VRCIAHRGFAETYPENTVAAVRGALDDTGHVEIDVRRCGSGDLVVIHDERVDRVTDESGPVADFSRAELDALDVLDSGEGVPALEAVFEAAPDAEFVLELKESGLAADALDLADDLDVSVTVSAFDIEVLESAAAVGDAPLAYLVTDGEARTGLETAAALDCAAIHPHWTACVDEFVAEAHERDLQVNAWTVPSRRDASALEYVGVDGLIVDRPEVVSERE